MAALLLIEKDEGLRKFLKDALPDAVIYTVRTRQETEWVIREARNSGTTFSAVVLDPGILTGAGGGSSEYADLAAAICPDGLLLVLTDQPNSFQADHLFAEQCLRQPGLKVLYVSKTAPDWRPLVRGFVSRHVYSSRIADRLARLRGRRPAQEFGTASRGGSGPLIGTLTQELADVAREIQLHWGELEEPLREQVRTVFRVEEGNPVRVSLF
jgi:hypothetical protein